MSTTNYTCITCHVAFTNADVQRLHYKSDWHRYNLKRKVVALPPISIENFQEKVTAQQALTANSQSQENVVGVACKACQRRFNSYNSYANHLKSKKHREAEAKELAVVKKKLEETSQVHIEKSESQDSDTSSELKAIDKALADARSSLQQPTILRSDTEKTSNKNFTKEDNPRLRWYRKQMREMKERKENDEADENSDEWEELSDDEETLGDNSESDVGSQADSNVTETSSLAGVMSRIKLDSDADVESLLSEQGRDQQMISPYQCLFCPKKLTIIEENVSHMSLAHGFFIPELPYLTDLEGLLSYLGEKVGVGNVCLWCNERGHAFYSLKAVRTHMKDKGHCKMFIEGDAALEYADFYDFSSSYPDYDPDDEATDEEIEVVDEDVQEDDSEEDMELVLPSGAKVGHRSLMRYYKQKFPTVDRYNGKGGKPRIERLMAQYKAIGWHGSSSAPALKKQEKDMKYIQSMKAKYLQHLGVKNNKTMMKHFRLQIQY
ncbi:unnamed protein product [Clavelina lepadiformis]|uniref:C2H2-type domain-containing protein n=1 Tax=Clavelina lepadiformis TaxID=159417 RepID=A0ABP0FT01_CLALP